MTEKKSPFKASGFVISWTDKDGVDHVGFSYHAHQVKNLLLLHKIAVIECHSLEKLEPILEGEKQKKLIIDGRKIKIIGYLD
jgi:hypothetical protein